MRVPPSRGESGSGRPATPRFTPRCSPGRYAALEGFALSLAGKAGRIPGRTRFTHRRLRATRLTPPLAGCAAVCLSAAWDLFARCANRAGRPPRKDGVKRDVTLRST